MRLPEVRPLQLRALEEPRPRRDIASPFNKLVGGWLCLDFVNTVHAWMPPSDGAHGDDDWPAGDRLSGYDALLNWVREAEMLGESDVRHLRDAATYDPEAAADVLERAVRLRGALYRIFSARLRDSRVPRDALEALRHEIERLRRGEYLAEGDDGGVDIVWGGSRDDLDAVLWPVARSALDLLASRKWLARLRQCAGEECGWLFVDVSRGGRRRWCAMSDCGNVSKVRAFRARE